MKNVAVVAIALILSGCIATIVTISEVIVATATVLEMNNE